MYQVLFFNSFLCFIFVFLFFIFYFNFLYIFYVCIPSFFCIYVCLFPSLLPWQLWVLMIINDILYLAF